MKPALFLKPIIRISGLIIIAASVTLLLIGIFYGKEVKLLLLDNVNRNLKTEIQVGSIDFSILRHFPYASVELRNVETRENKTNPGARSLLKAEKVSLLFNLMGVFSKDVAIKKIIVSNGDIYISVNDDGSDNYHFWKSAGGDTTSVVNLENVTLQNVGITYSNPADRQEYIFESVNGALRGEFSHDQFELKTNADFITAHFIAGGTDYLPGKEMRLRSVLKVNTHTNIYEFRESKLRIADLEFDVHGTVTSLEHTTLLNLAVNSAEADLPKLLSLLPARMNNFFSGFESKGRFNFHSTITGKADNKHVPDFRFTYSLSNGALRPRRGTITLDHLTLSGSMEAKSAKPAELSISSFKGMLNGRPVEGQLALKDFETPYLTLRAKADLDLNSIREFIRQDTLESLRGRMKVDVSFAGNIKDLRQYASKGNYRNDASGCIDLENVSLKLKQNPLEYNGISGRFMLHDNHVEVESLKGKVSSTDFSLHGSLRNFITFLLIPNQEANMNISVSSSFIDLNEILENKTVVSNNDTSYKININPRLVCNLDVSADRIVFRKFEATAIRGKIHIEDQVITSPSLNFDAMDGNVAMSANIHTGRRDSILMGCRAKITNLDITELFRQLENFGEQTVTDKNLKGRVSAEVVFNSSWTKDLVINPNKVVAGANITIEQGELNNFKPILSLSKYLKLADLNHIRFSTLKNQIEIRDRKIYFPTMEIKSSALNLNASGTHDFDNTVDYKLNMLLSDVLGKKVKSQNSEFGTIEDDGLGHTKLYLSMKGSVDDPRFSYDNKGVSEKIAQDFRQDRQQMKQLFKQEFGMFRKDSTVKPVKKKKEEMQIDWDEMAGKN